MVIVKVTDRRVDRASEVRTEVIGPFDDRDQAQAWIVAELAPEAADFGPLISIEIDEVLRPTAANVNVVLYGEENPVF